MTQVAQTTRPAETPLLHVVSILDWQREGEHPFDLQRADLLDTVARLLDRMQSTDPQQHPLKALLLGGQTVLVEDVAAVRGDLVSLMVIYHGGGRLGLGVWYAQVDDLLVSGEALVRNLLLGRADVLKHGTKPLSTAYLPNGGWHPAQLPQILRGFNIHSLLIRTGKIAVPLPFRWVALNGEDILVAPYASSSVPHEAVARQRDSQPDGPFLWLSDPETDGDMPAMSDISVGQSTLSDYIAMLRETLPDVLRPALMGELRLSPNYEADGRFSARQALKVQHHQLQALLERGAEPLIALALSHSKTPNPQSLRALLEYSWRMLIQNQSLSTLGGLGSDAVEAEVRQRYRRVNDLGQHLVNQALTHLEMPPRSNSRAQHTHLVVWNMHGRPVRQHVRVRLSLGAGSHPISLQSSEGDDVVFTWEAETQHISFIASAPSVGYSTYRLTLSSDEPSAYARPNRANGRIIGDGGSTTLALDGRQLTWTGDAYRITNLLDYFDGGDDGSIEGYRRPETDVLVRADVGYAAQVETTPTYERLIFRSRLRIAQGIENGRRERGLKPLDIVTSATLYYELPGLHFQTEFQNSANDHRLRAHIRTEQRDPTLFVDTAFGLQKRQNTGLQPLHQLAAITGNDGALALITAGLHELEPFAEDEQTSLALTLLRAVGHLDARKSFATPEAQCQGTHTPAWWLFQRKDANPAELLHLAQSLSAPLQVFQMDEAPRVKARGYLALSNSQALLSALKPPASGDGWVVRLHNPSDAPITTTLTPFGKLAAAYQLRLDETRIAEMTLQDGALHLTIAPHQLLTVGLQFVT